jgi:hypothetical protein
VGGLYIGILLAHPILHISMISVNARPGPFYPREGNPLPIAQGADWALGPVWTGAKYLVYIQKKYASFLVPSSTATVNGMSWQMQALGVIMLFRSETR